MLHSSMGLFKDTLLIRKKAKMSVFWSYDEELGLRCATVLQLFPNITKQLNQQPSYEMIYYR